MMDNEDFASREFDLLSASSRTKTAVRLGAVEDIEAVYKLIGRHICPPYAPPAAMELAISLNRQTLSLFERNKSLVGFHAALFLSERGMAQLKRGEFNALAPEPSCLVNEQTAPAAVYVWMVIAPSLAVEGMLQIAENLREPLNRRADLYARPATPEGERLMISFGYQPMPNRVPTLYRYVRHKNRALSRQHAA